VAWTDPTGTDVLVHHHNTHHRSSPLVQYRGVWLSRLELCVLRLQHRRAGQDVNLRERKISVGWIDGAKICMIEWIPANITVHIYPVFTSMQFVANLILRRWLSVHAYREF